MGKGACGPLDLRVDLVRLELDKRIQDRRRPQYAELWDVFKPQRPGRRLRSPGPGPGRWSRRLGATVDCRDVEATYEHFPYPLEHVSGRLTLEGQRLTVELHGLIGERPAFMKGTIDNPGPDAVVRLQIQAESVPDR